MYVGSLVGLILCKEIGCCEFMSVIDRSCPEDGILQHANPLCLKFFLPILLGRSLNLGRAGVDKDVSLKS